MASERKKNKAFLRIICPRCKNLQIVYGKATTRIKCNECGYLLIRTTGGKTKIKAKVREIIKNGN